MGQGCWGRARPAWAGPRALEGGHPAEQPRLQSGREPQAALDAPNTFSVWLGSRRTAGPGALRDGAKEGASVPRRPLRPVSLSPCVLYARPWSLLLLVVSQREHRTRSPRPRPWDLEGGWLRPCTRTGTLSLVSGTGRATCPEASRMLQAPGTLAICSSPDSSRLRGRNEDLARGPQSRPGWHR